jgi:hypothetical protein
LVNNMQQSPRMNKNHKGAKISNYGQMQSSQLDFEIKNKIKKFYYFYTCFECLLHLKTQ